MEKRILRFVKVESNDGAFFITLQYFLERCGEKHAEFSLKLLRNHSSTLNEFIPFILKGLYKSDKNKEVNKLLSQWIGEGYNLNHISFSFFLSENENLLLETLYEKCLELESNCSLVDILRVANKFENVQLIQKITTPIIQVFTKNRYTAWTQFFYFRPKQENCIVFMKYLDEKDMDNILENLIYEKSLNAMNSEYVLASITHTYPKKVLDFFAKRLEYSQSKIIEGYEPFPHRLNILNDSLSKDAQLFFSSIRNHYNLSDKYFKFNFGLLIRNVFPCFTQEIERYMNNLMEARSKGDISFIIEVLNSYNGELFLLNTCKEIIRHIHIDDTDLLNKLKSAMLKTGIVQGEFGFIEAYKQKKINIVTWLDDPNENVKLYAREFTRKLDNIINSEHRHAVEREIINRHEFEKE